MSPPETTPTTPHNSDPEAIFDPDGPISPNFITEAIRTLMRTLPLGSDEPDSWSHRRMRAAMQALTFMQPRDGIEVMIGVQAIAAYHAAAACWRLGMNHHQPNGDSTRHFATAASAARTFDALLKALERRQARPLGRPAGRPPRRVWNEPDPTAFMDSWSTRCRGDETLPANSTITWTPKDLEVAHRIMKEARIAEENQGLDIANTEGILPGGGMIIPENPTPQQDAYLARRLALRMKREYAENLRKGIKKLPKIPIIRTGELME